MDRSMQLGYMGVEVSDPEAFARYAADILGLQPGHAIAGQASTWRMDAKAHRLIVEQGDADDVAYTGFVLADRTSFDDALGRLRDAGYDPSPASEKDVTARQVSDLVHVTAPWGVRIELSYGLADAAEPFDSPLLPGGFLTGDLGLGHAVFFVTGEQSDFDAADRFAVDGLGLKLSDYLEIDMGGLPVVGNFYHCNGRHHSMALIFVPVPEFPKTLDHIMIETVSMDNVGHAYDRALTAGIPIARDLGRHPNDRMFSFYSVSPAGFQFELGAGAVTVNDDWEVVKYDRISAWGHHAGTPVGA
jgi:2,3-dihydroxybiphenyl 1,2-dioxygenase